MKPVKSIGKYSMSRFASTGMDANYHWLAATTGGSQFSTIRFWESSDNCGAGAPSTAYEAVYLIAVDGHPCWALLSESESPDLLARGAALSVKALEAEMTTCPDCRSGAHLPPPATTIYPDRDEPRGGFAQRVRALLGR